MFAHLCSCCSLMDNISKVQQGHGGDRTCGACSVTCAVNATCPPLNRFGSLQRVQSEMHLKNQRCELLLLSSILKYLRTCAHTGL